MLRHWLPRALREPARKPRTSRPLAVERLEDRTTPAFTGGVSVAAGDWNGDGFQDIATGAGPGGGPHVKVFSGATGEEMASFFAFTESFTGGVNVAMGDVDGDGRVDLIAGAGFGGGPHVKAFSGRTGAEIASFFAYADSFAGGVNVGAADLDGDGVDEILTGAGIGGGPHVKAFDARSGAVVRDFMAFDPGFGGGASVAGGDMNGDGRAEIAVGAGPGLANAPVRVFDGASGATLLDRPAFDGFAGGSRVAVADVDGDGANELLAAAMAGGGPRVRAFELDGTEVGGAVGSFFAYGEGFAGGVFLAAADLNADGTAEVVTGAGPGGGAHVKGIVASSLTEVASFVAYDPVFTGGGFSVGVPTTDTTPPTIALSPLAKDRTNVNPTLSGVAADAGSGVAGVAVSVDGGGFVPLPVGPGGVFVFVPTLPLDSTADGLHVVRFRATDRAGNVSAAVSQTFILDTVPPTASLSLAGSVNVVLQELTVQLGEPPAPASPGQFTVTRGGVGVAVTSVTLLDDGYRIRFADPLPNGDYQLTLTRITDAAGNAATPTTFTFTIAAPPSVTSISPGNGSGMVSLTRETRVTFNVPVDAATLTADSFYLIAKGAKIPGTIRVAPNGLSATFFQTAPLPESTEVRVVVDGNGVAGRDGVKLDGDGNGVAGGQATADFRTLPLTLIPGTRVFGYVYDSYAKTPDGKDIPVVGAKISLDANPAIFADTDANGFFELGLQDLNADGTADGLPAPEFFVHIDGSAATSSALPAGSRYATLGKPFHSVPGQRVQLRMDGSPVDVDPTTPGDQFHMYLPPMAGADVVALDPAKDTTVGFGPSVQGQFASLFPNLTPEQLALLSLMSVTYPAGSAVDGATGTAATQAMIVPVNPLRLPAPLPPGLNPSLVISIQAGTAAGFNLAGGNMNFETPAPVTFPNLDGLAPGSQPAIWSFDHDVGMWVPIGTGTVTADGKTIVADAGVGILAPGWHFTSPPQNWTGAGDPPPKPKGGDEPEPTVDQRLFYTGDSDTLSFTFTAPTDGKKPEPGKHDKPGKGQPSRVVTIKVDGPLSDYYKAKTGGGVRAGTWTLKPGDKDLELASTLKTLDELKRDVNGNKPFDFSYLYGSKIEVKEVYTAADGSKSINKRVIFPYLVIDATDDKHDDKSLSFAPTANDGGGGVEREVPFVLRTGGSSRPKLTVLGGNGFSRTADLLKFDPTAVGDLTANLEVREPLKNNVAGMVSLQGKAVERQGWYMDPTSFETLLASMAADTKGVTFPTLTAADRALINTKVKRDALFADIAQRTQDTLLSPLTKGIYRATAGGANVLTISFVQGANPAPGKGWPLGGAVGSLTAADVDQAKIVDVYTNRNDYGRFERAYRAAVEMNKQLGGSINFFLDNYFEGQFDSNGDGVVDMDTAGEIVNTLAMNNAHEIGHHLGLFHTNTATWAGPAGGSNDIMRQGLDLPGTLRFRLTLEAGKMGVHGTYTGREADKAIAYYALPGIGSHNIEGPGDDGDTGPGVPVFTTPTLGVIDGDGGVVVATSDLGTAVVDGVGGAFAETVWTLANFGPGAITISSVALGAGDPAFQIVTNPTGQVLSGDTIAQLGLRFDPTRVGTSQRDITITTSTGEVITTTLVARGLAATAAVGYAVGTNNLGGATVGGTPVASESVGTITNDGALPLVITNIRVPAGEEFRVVGFDPASPVTLAPGETFSFGATFSPSAVGLRRGTVRISTNDPTRPDLDVGVVGTGTPAGGLDFHWGNDYVVFSSGGFTQRAVSNAAGEFVFNANTFDEYTVSIFDPVSGLIATSIGQTGPSGAYTDLTSDLEFRPSTAPDSDGDGLPDDIEQAIGTGPTLADTDGDGLDDFSELEQGLNPLDGIGFPTGVIASLAMPGSAEEVAVANDLVYVATGDHGLAILDGAKFDAPVLLGQIDLDGFATDVAVDPARNIAAVATGSALVLVDVSDPMLPKVLRSISVGVNQVEVVNGFAFAATGNGITVVDLATADTVGRVSLPGAGSVTGMGVSGTHLFAYVSGSDTLAVVDVSKPEAAAVVGQLAVGIASSDVGLFAGNGVVWLAGSGLTTVDVSDPTKPTLISGADSFFTSRRVALNGSGLALQLPDGGNTVNLYDSSDPAATDRFVTQFTLSGLARGVAVSRGIGYVAAGGRLEVINYRPFDTGGVAPTVSLQTDLTDVDPATPGFQVLEGGAVSVRAITADDVQVRSVEFLVNGVSVGTDVSFPFETVVNVPRAADGSTMTVQVRATDTGGNVTLSDLLTLQVVPDTFAPTVERIDPADGSSRFVGTKTVRVRFSESLAPASITAANFVLTGAGANGTFGDADDVTVPVAVSGRDRDRLVQITAADLPAGLYRLTIAEAGITDLAGNPLGTGTRTSTFSVVARPTVDGLFALRGEDKPGDFILTGTDFRVGVNADGSFITSDQTVGLEAFGTDFILPGTPLAGFTVSRNGENFTNESPAGGSAISVALQDLSAGTFHGWRAEGVVGGNLRMERVVVWNDGEQYFTIAIRLTNIGDTDLTQVAFLENHDPDQGTPIGVGPSTNNDVVLDGRLALASVVNDTFPAGLTMGFGSADPRSTVSIEQFYISNPFDVIDSPEDPQGVLGDTGMGLAFNFGTLRPGESATAAFALVLGRSTDEAIAVYESSGL